MSAIKIMRGRAMSRRLTRVIIAMVVESADLGRLASLKQQAYFVVCAAASTSGKDDYRVPEFFDFSTPLSVASIALNHEALFSRKVRAIIR